MPSRKAKQPEGKERKKLSAEDEKKLQELTGKFADLMLMQIDEKIAKQAKKKRRHV